MVGQELNREGEKNEKTAMKQATQVKLRYQYTPNDHHWLASSLYSRTFDTNPSIFSESLRIVDYEVIFI